MERFWEISRRGRQEKQNQNSRNAFECYKEFDWLCEILVLLFDRLLRSTVEVTSFRPAHDISGYSIRAIMILNYTGCIHITISITPMSVTQVVGTTLLTRCSYLVCEL
jgi:hypothetical protein